MKFKLYIFAASIFLFFSQPVCLLSNEAITTTASPPVSAAKHGKFTLLNAVICEDIKEQIPFNTAVVFSIAVGKILCFTNFDQVTEKAVIYHNWYRSDKLNSRIKLNINSPRWSTYSNIQLRENDKGPWRVEITDQDGNIFQILRFSIVD